jgi:two-component system, LytTR family, sensor histidine kinase AgrC
MAQYSQLWYMIVYIVIIVLSVRYILNLKYVDTILATSILLLFSTFVQYAVEVTLRLFTHGNINFVVWTQSFYLTAILRNLANLFWIFGGILIYLLRMKIHLPGDLSRRRSFTILVNCIVTAILVIPNCLFFEFSLGYSSSGILIFNIFSVFILLLISISYSNKSGHLELKKQESEFQKLYTSTLENGIDGMRGIKHDYNNVVQALGGYITLNDMEGLKKYYKQMQSESRTINNTLPLSAYLVDNPALYGLILSKITYCEVKDIELYVNIFSKINLYKIKMYDFCKVLGILLDNAIEAAEESDRKYAELSIKENYSQNELVIEVSNSYHGDVNLEKINESGYTTKKEHSGFGLWEVKKILSKYDSCELKTLCSQDFFIQTINIFH